MIKTLPNGRKQVEFNDTRFIFNTNFDGDPEKDNFGSSERKGNVVIGDHELAEELRRDGFNVRTTKPRPGYEDEFVPEDYIAVKVNFNTPPGLKPPKICLVSANGNPIPLDEESIKTIDELQLSRSITNVNVTCNLRYNKDGRNTLYVQYMYVEQDVDNDPYAARYQHPNEDEDVPF